MAGATYAITENVPSGYDQTDLTCDGNGGTVRIDQTRCVSDSPTILSSESGRRD